MSKEFLMQAKEMQVGNWYDHNGEYKQVTPNTILEVWEAERAWCKPIPLTPEVLDKCPQITKHTEDGCYSYDDCFRFSWKSNYNYFYVQSYACRDYITKIEFLHELQNFFNALRPSDTELIVNF